MIVTLIGQYGVVTSAGDQYPGAVVDLPDAEARRLVARGRARVVDAAASAPAPADSGPLTTQAAAPVAPSAHKPSPKGRR